MIMGGAWGPWVVAPAAPIFKFLSLAIVKPSMVESLVAFLPGFFSSISIISQIKCLSPAFVAAIIATIAEFSSLASASQPWEVVSKTCLLLSVLLSCPNRNFVLFLARTLEKSNTQKYIETKIIMGRSTTTSQKEQDRKHRKHKSNLHQIEIHHSLKSAGRLIFICCWILTFELTRQSYSGF